MCHVPYTSSTRHRETDTAMRVLAYAYQMQQRAILAGSDCGPWHPYTELAWRYFRLATDPLGHLPRD